MYLLFFVMGVLLKRYVYVNYKIVWFQNSVSLQFCSQPIRIIRHY